VSRPETPTGVPADAPRQGADVDHDLIAQADPQRDRYTDADLYGQIDKSQQRIPWWLGIMVGVVILFAVVLNAPFLGGRGMTPLDGLMDGSGPILDVGMLMALVYVGGGFALIFWFTWKRKGS
jgi:hypothetical protein